MTPSDRAAVGATDNAFAAALHRVPGGAAADPDAGQLHHLAARTPQRDAVKTAILNAPAPGPIPVTAQPVGRRRRAGGRRVDARRARRSRTALAAAGDAAEDRSSNLAGRQLRDPHARPAARRDDRRAGGAVADPLAAGAAHARRWTSRSAGCRRRWRACASGGAPDVNVEPVPLHTRDEVGQVARAFDTVHGQALRLAADQAALQSNVSSMFVNLSRRSQALVERQLQLIEQLESNEQDPDQLSNLFQLDHLATRMRRNSENLLVLAGTDLAKRNVAPVPLVDVLRAAVSEIEQYQRIVVQAPPQATVVGPGRPATSSTCSPSCSTTPRTSPRPTPRSSCPACAHGDGSIVVEIADSGVGHARPRARRRQPAARARRRPSTSPPRGAWACSWSGASGARHGITVHLGGAPMGGPGGGLTASVTLPAHLVMVSGDGPSRGPMRRPPPSAQPSSPRTASCRSARACRTGPRRTPRWRRRADGRPVERPTGLNGLPTRTPGSAR